LYREKPSKADKRKSVTIAEPRGSRALVPRAAYVEDAPDIDIPPAAPSPPPAVPAQPVRSVEPVNVFDFLVAENTPNASRVSLGGSHEQMSMKRGAQSIFSDSQNEKQDPKAGNNHREEPGYDEDYEAHGFTYGTEPVKPAQFANPNGSLASLDFMTPAAKVTKARIDRTESAAHSRTNSGTTSDKKRKRGSPEALDLSTIKAKGIRRREHHDDTPMADAPPSSADTPSLAHSGLTGGLNRLLSETRDPFPPTPDYSDEKEYAREMDRKTRHSQAEHPPSPLKRSRHSKDDRSSTNPGPGFSIKGRAGRIMSMVGGASTGGALSVLNPAGLQNKETALVKTKQRNSSSEDGRRGSREGRKVERKKVKIQRPASMLSSIRRESSTHGRGEKYSSTTSNTSRRRRGSNESPEARRRKVKAIEYHYPRQNKDSNYHAAASDSDSDDDHSHSTATHRHHHITRPRGGGSTTTTTTTTRVDGSEMIVFGEEQRLAQRAESFLSYVTKGPDSERGCSVNKALKRWHRDGAGTGSEHGGSKEEEQKELWRGLRLRRNDRGEIVVFF
jgi:cell growth-regulating nucleolar protein